MAPSTARGGRRRPRVLIVDDDPVIRGVVRAVLEDGSYELGEAVDGDDALRAVQEQRPDLVLLDVMMPGMDGFEVASRIKSNPHSSDTIVVMLTAKDSPEDRKRGFASGADAYFTKPFSPLELLFTLAGALQ